MKKIAIITGVTSGIGLATAEIFQKNGYTIHGIARNMTKLKELQSQKKILNFDVADFSKPSSVEKLLLNFDFASYDQCVLINNAGQLGPKELIADMPYDELMETFHVNTGAPFLLSRNFYKKMKDARKKSPGLVIQVSTGAAFHGYKGLGAYCMTKASLWLMTQCLALEWDPAIAQVCALAPGVVETKMVGEIHDADPATVGLSDFMKNLRKEDKLYPTSLPAQYMLDLVTRSGFPHGQHLDLRKDQ